LLDPRGAGVRLRHTSAPGAAAALGRARGVRRVFVPDVSCRGRERPRPGVAIVDGRRQGSIPRRGAGGRPVENPRRNDGTMNRAEFPRLVSVGGAAPFPLPRLEWPNASPIPSTGAAKYDEPYWKTVRDQFVMPDDLAVLNAANLCPSSAPVLETLY